MIETSHESPGLIRIVLADDQSIIRQGLRLIIETQKDMIVVGEANNGDQAIALAKESNPDMVLMDIQMPGKNGIAATRSIVEDNPNVKVILLTTFDIQEYVADGIRAGAIGYLLKDSDTRTLLEGIRSANEGAAIYQTKTAAKALAEAVRIDRLESYDAEAEPLTEKELEVLQLMAYGRRNSEIAAALCISEGTVKTHVHHILGKLGALDRTQAVVIAIRSRLVK